MRTTVELTAKSIEYMTETIVTLETTMRAGTQRQAQAVKTLLSGQGFSYMFDMWLDAAVKNINDPGLPKLEMLMRTWAPASRDVDFGLLRKMIREMSNRVRRERGRDARLTDEEVNDLLSEVMGP